MNTNPFASINIPTPPQIGNRQTKPQVALHSQPSATSPQGLRDLAILRLKANGLTLRQIHRLNLLDLNEAQGILVVQNRNRKKRMVILETDDQQILSRWLVVRQLFVSNTEAVFISLHWTSGRSKPGQRLSERSLNNIINTYLHSNNKERQGHE